MSFRQLTDPIDRLPAHQPISSQRRRDSRKRVTSLAFLFFACPSPPLATDRLFSLIRNLVAPWQPSSVRQSAFVIFSSLTVRLLKTRPTFMGRLGTSSNRDSVFPTRGSSIFCLVDDAIDAARRQRPQVLYPFVRVANVDITSSSFTSSQFVLASAALSPANAYVNGIDASPCSHIM